MGSHIHQNRMFQFHVYQSILRGWIEVRNRDTGHVLTAREYQTVARLNPDMTDYVVRVLAHPDIAPTNSTN